MESMSKHYVSGKFVARHIRPTVKVIVSNLPIVAGVRFRSPDGSSSAFRKLRSTGQTHRFKLNWLKRNDAIFDTTILIFQISYLFTISETRISEYLDVIET